MDKSLSDIESLYALYTQHHQQFSTDTRNIKSGDVYFALKGENFNGNLFAAKALEAGAAYAIVDEDQQIEDARFIRVENVLKCMQQLGLHHRRQFNIPFVAIAGSNGKTTTKELVYSCLSKKYRVHATAGNFNNHIGVPNTLLRMPTDTEMTIIEIGTNNFGEIDFLCQILEPDFGIITNIGKEHLEGFGDLDGVAKEELALFEYLDNHNGFAFLNLDDPYLYKWLDALDQKRTFSIQQSAHDQFEVKAIIPKIEMTGKGSHFFANLQGKHNAQNMAAAISIGRYFGVSDDDLADALEGYQAKNNRSEWRTIGSNSFMLDAYNANPSSMNAALNTFTASSHAAKVALLGDMFEMGNTSDAEHEALALAAWHHTELDVFLVGEAFSKVCIKHNRPVFANVDTLILHLKKINYQNTWFLIKGSRSMKMERVLEAFEG